jgi:hypothetical protein
MPSAQNVLAKPPTFSITLKKQQSITSSTRKLPAPSKAYKPSGLNTSSLSGISGGKEKQGPGTPNFSQRVRRQTVDANKLLSATVGKIPRQS